MDKSLNYQNIYDLLYNLRTTIENTQEQIKNLPPKSSYLIIPISVYEFDNGKPIILAQNHFMIIFRNFSIKENDKQIYNFDKFQQILLLLMKNYSPAFSLKNTDTTYVRSFIKLDTTEILFKTESEKNIFDLKIKSLINNLKNSYHYSVKFVFYYIPYIIT
jgi:hypothetical protein